MIARTINSERIKLLTTRSPYWCVAIVAVIGLGLAVIIGSASGSEDSGVRTSVSPTLFALGVYQVGVVVLTIMAVLSVTSEFRFGTIRTTFLATPNRALVLVAKAIVYGLLAAVVAGVLNIAAMLIGKALTSGSHTVDLAAADAVRSYWGMPVFAFCAVLIGIGVGALVRQTAGAIVILMVWMLVLENVLVSIPHVGDDVGPWLPFQNAGRFLAADSSMDDTYTGYFHWGIYGSLVYFVVISLIVFGAGVAATVRRDA
ncbi:ABC transporter permease [Gordonia jinhuaensis]|uniref:ABC transporter permease n=1 Tax=Gordonia jinhuaensis TaxID=1517702 RepID=A0A916WZG1_9ACTN|nr:ABC transporter permease [Gordonia jinhuaensis]GGB41975.1 ABC transporter permease [Gordonia jinhuaensis]